MTGDVHEVQKAVTFSYHLQLITNNHMGTDGDQTVKVSRQKAANIKQTRIFHCRILTYNLYKKLILVIYFKK